MMMRTLRLRGQLACLLCTLAYAACSADPHAPDDAASGSDGAALSPDGGGPVGCTPSCPGGSVCANGACTPVPTHCPCPVESYCDLASDTCKVGCLDDSQCSLGRYCDAPARTCRPGCRGDSDCQSPMSGVARCVAHACATTCDRGYHLCGAACASNSALSSCGATSCAPCATPPNAAPTCDGTTCGYNCAAGFADCNGVASDGCERAATPILCYQDADGDGFGNKAVTQSFPCGACPTGWTAKADVFDCYDGNKDVYPGQMKYFTTPYGASSSFDYDCDTKITKQDGAYSKFSSGPCYITFPSTMGCGQSESLPICLPGNYETFVRGCR